MSAIKKEEEFMKTNDMSNRIVRVETVIEHINFMLERMDKRFDEVDARFTKLDKKIDDHAKDVKQQLEKFDSRMWTNFYWILGTMLTLAITGAGIMAKGFGWFN